MQRYDPNEGYQRHHDYYVKLLRSGKLMSKEDRKQLELAMSREQQGKVKPLPDTPQKEEK